MEVLTLMIIYPILFFSVGIVLRMLLIKWKVKFYLLSILIFSFLAIFLLIFEFNNITGTFMYVPIYIAIGVLGSLVLQGIIGLVRLLNTK